MVRLKPKNTYKHVLNFVSKYESRPILTGIHFTSEGHIEATDNHILIKLYDRVGEGIDRTIDPKTLNLIEGTYPGIDRLIPKSSTTDFTLDDAAIQSIFTFSKSLPKRELISVTLENNALTLTSNGLETKVDVQSKQDFSITLRAEYVKYVFDFLRDNTFEVTVHFNGVNRPMAFTDEKTFDLLITPVRTKQ